MSKNSFFSLYFIFSGWPVLLVDGKWHHFCVSWENIGGHLKLYKDGTLFGQSSSFETGQVIKSGGWLMLAQMPTFTRYARDSLVGMLTND